MANRTTISDVARLAGVSSMTVSRVLNQREDVSAKTRERVQNVIRELDYHPNAIARSLTMRETHTIGLVIPDVSNPFFADVTRGIENLAIGQGYHIFLCNTQEDPARELAVIQSLEEKRVDGIIICGSRLEEKLLAETLAHLPAAVLINRRLIINNVEPFQSVVLDDEVGGRIATQHLIQSGRHKIGFLAGPANSYSGQGRLKGYRYAMEAAGIAPEPGWIMNCQPSVEGGHQACHQLLTQYPQLEAIFCYNDLVAVGVLQAAQELGRRIPEDLAVVGHDDIPLAGLVSPKLTTCRVPRQELGALAVNALIERFAGCPKECRQIILQPELIIRQSAP